LEDVLRSVADINEPEALKQAAMLLEHENERQHTRLKELIAENAKLSGKESAKQLELEIMKLQEQLALGRGRRCSGIRARSEELAGKADAGQENGRGTEAARPRTASATRTRRCPSAARPARGRPCLPRLRPAGVCEWDGQTEDSEEIIVIERQFKIVKHQRKKYRCKTGLRAGHGTWPAQADRRRALFGGFRGLRGNRKVPVPPAAGAAGAHV
jgi:hypothetical protein